jgi:hypothetical protein
MSAARDARAVGPDQRARAADIVVGLAAEQGRNRGENVRRLRRTVVW